MDVFVQQLRTGDNGLRAYIMAVACAQLTGIGDKNAGADWASAQQWLALYDKSDKSTAIPPMTATDYYSGKQARLLPITDTGDKPRAADYGDANTLVLDGENGQNQILLAPAGFSFSGYKIYLPDGAVYDYGTRTVYDSLGLRVMYSANGVCLIAPFQTGTYIYEVVLSWPEQDLTRTYGLKVVMTGQKSDYDRAVESVFAAYRAGNPRIAVSLVDRYTLANAAFSESHYLFKVDNIAGGPLWVEVSEDTGQIIGVIEDPGDRLVDPPPVGSLTHVSGSGNTGQ